MQYREVFCLLSNLGLISTSEIEEKKWIKYSEMIGGGSKSLLSSLFLCKDLPVSYGEICCTF